MGYNYDSEDSEQTRQRKLQRLIADAQESQSSKTFWLLFTACYLLPIIPLAFILWMPLWTKWSVPGFLGVVAGWGSALIIILLAGNYLT